MSTTRNAYPELASAVRAANEGEMDGAFLEAAASAGMVDEVFDEWLVNYYDPDAHYDAIPAANASAGDFEGTSAELDGDWMAGVATAGPVEDEGAAVFAVDPRMLSGGQSSKACGPCNVARRKVSK